MEQFFETYWWAIILFSIWSLTWKGIALWKAAAINHDKAWFFILLIFNTLGVLEIVYIFFLPDTKQDK